MLLFAGKASCCFPWHCWGSTSEHSFSVCPSNHPSICLSVLSHQYLFLSPLRSHIWWRMPQINPLRPNSCTLYHVISRYFGLKSGLIPGLKLSNQLSTILPSWLTIIMNIVQAGNRYRSSPQAFGLCFYRNNLFYNNNFYFSYIITISASPKELLIVTNCPYKQSFKNHERYKCNVHFWWISKRTFPAKHHHTF